MKRQDAFSACHPAAQLLYFLLVLLGTVCVTHPVSLGISLTCSLVCAVQLNGRAAVRRGLTAVLPLLLLAAAAGPLFIRQGETVLGYLPTGGALTLESILAGLGAAGMLAAAVTWLSCCAAVLTADKVAYLFGRALPALSLVLSMTLRFAPRFAAQLRAVGEARRSLGLGVSGGTLARRVRRTGVLLSALVAWSLENAVETADSMKSRGYGLPGRTFFALYRFRRRDRAVLLWLVFCLLYLLAGALAGCLDWRYYPTVGGAGAGALFLSVQAVYLALCLTPLILNGREARAWTRSPSGT